MPEICSIRCCPRCDKELSNCSCQKVHMRERDELCRECCEVLRKTISELHDYLNSPEGSCGLVGVHANRLASASKLLYQIRLGSGVSGRQLP